MSQGKYQQVKQGTGFFSAPFSMEDERGKSFNLLASCLVTQRMPGKTNLETIVEKQLGLWSDGETMWKKKGFGAQIVREDTGEKMWEDLQDLLQYISVCLVLKSHAELHVRFCSKSTGIWAYVCKSTKDLKVTPPVPMVKNLRSYAVIKLSKSRHFYFRITVFSAPIQEKQSSNSLKACSLKMMPT